MLQSTEQDQWKDRYREVLAELDAKERDWQALDGLLRRAASQLAIAAMGHSEELDGRVQEVLEGLRSELDPEELTASLRTLGQSLKSVPDVTGVQPRLEEAGSRDIQAIMGRLVERVATFPELADSIKEYRERLKPNARDDEWAGWLGGIADSMAQLVSSLQSQKRELEEFLEEVTAQLARFERWTHDTLEADKKRATDSRELETTMQVGMQGIQDEVTHATNPAELKLKVQMRLDAVVAGFETYKEREAARHLDAAKRNHELNEEITRLRDKTAQLNELVRAKEGQLMLDALTRVHSRYAYEQRIREEFQRWERHGHPLAFVLWDVDHFKSVNDTYGHSAGDKLLRVVANILRRMKRAEDFIARIGGEEFVLLLPVTNLEEATIFANRVRETIAKTPFHHKGTPEYVTVSCGVTEFRAGDTPLLAYQRADDALYEAKQAGRNRCTAR
jgi:diguanylate cyclase